MKNLITVPIWMAIALAPIEALPIPDAIATADAIVVATVTDGTYDGSQYSVTLTVQRSLQGSLVAGTAVHAIYIPTNRATRAGVITKEQGLFFLKNTQPTWSIISVDSDGIGLASVYFPITGAGPVPSAAPVGDKVIQELAAAAASTQDAQYAFRFVSRLSGNSSPIVTQTLRQWAAMPVSPAHAYGLAGLIASGDSGAVQQFSAEWSEISKLPNASQAGSSLNAFRGSDPLAVRAIGRIATAANAPDTVRSATAWALSNIHSKETLPYLYTLLGSPDQTIRGLAVRGFSAFVTNMRVATGGLDSSEALDEILNPGRVQAAARSSFDTPDTRKFLHFGVFQSAQEETSFIAFWKLWFDQNRGVLAL